MAKLFDAAEKALRDPRDIELVDGDGVVALDDGTLVFLCPCDDADAALLRRFTDAGWSAEEADALIASALAAE